MRQKVKTWWQVAMVTSLVVTGAGGGLMLAENLSAASWSLGLNMLVLGIIGFVVSALGGWLTRNDHPASEPVPAAPSGSAVARLVFVVRQDRRALFESLRASLAGEDNVVVVLDRREHPRAAFDWEVRARGWSVARVGG